MARGVVFAPVVRPLVRASRPLVLHPLGGPLLVAGAAPLGLPPHTVPQPGAPVAHLGGSWPKPVHLLLHELGRPVLVAVPRRVRLVPLPPLPPQPFVQSVV